MLSVCSKLVKLKIKQLYFSQKPFTKVCLSMVKQSVKHFFTQNSYLPIRKNLVKLKKVTV